MQKRKDLCIYEKKYRNIERTKNPRHNTQQGFNKTGNKLYYKSTMYRVDHNYLPHWGKTGEAIPIGVML